MIGALATWFFVSLGVASACAPFIFRWLVRAKSRQTISEFVPEHAQKQGTPTMGGLIVLAGLVPLACAMQQWTAAALLVGFGLIGFLDDYVVPKVLVGKRGLGWKPKLGLQVLWAVGALMIGGTTNAVALAIGVFLVLAYCNAYNFADGLDGLAGSLALGLAGGMGFMAALTGVGGGIPTTMAGLIGALIPFMFLNAPPARVFLGDVGALPIGALFGWVAWSLAQVPGMAGPVALISLVMVAELLPPPMQIAAVKLLGRRIFPKTPIHHAFQVAGWPETRIVWSFALVQLICTLSAVAWASWALVPAGGPR